LYIHTNLHRISRFSSVPERSALREHIKEAIKRMTYEQATNHTGNIVTGEGEEDGDDTHANTPTTTFLLVMQTKH